MMFIRVPVEKLIQEQEKGKEQSRALAGQDLLNLQDPTVQEVLTQLTDGVLIITCEKKIVYANECACRILRQINQDRDHAEAIPREIIYLCNSLSDIHRQFSGQHWFVNTKICINSSIAFSVQARYMKLNSLRKDCIVLVLKDHYQLIKSIAQEESRKYNLTDRETEIWLLQRANYTYKQIATELFIAPNTVKKHMQNIHLKQKGDCDDFCQQSSQRS
jgi:DNA-binding CsgD family transcriptional regulator